MFQLYYIINFRMKHLASQETHSWTTWGMGHPPDVVEFFK